MRTYYMYVFLSEYTLTARAPRVIPAEIQFIIRPCARYFIMFRRRKKPHWNAQTFSSGTTSRALFLALRASSPLTPLNAVNVKEEMPSL